MEGAAAMTTTQQIFTALGGIGMFLLGMDILSGALREAAGARLRGVLARFTTTPLRGVATGALVTSIIQSSSATTVMTVGFVGAGLLSLGQALGILYGANIGTTMTGWLVTLFGLKLDLANIAMATLLPAALALLLARGAVARAGRVLAGLALMLIGLELMQTALSGATGLVLPQSLAGAGIWALVQLAAAGLAVTILIQSSSAAVALTLVMLQGGVIDIAQAAAMVVGMNVGTTFTALMASIGGSRQMRQTAVANLLFNIVTGMIALPLVLLAPGLLARLAQDAGPLNALMVFHTGFNLAGTALFLPLTPAYTRLIQHLVPEGREALEIRLDRALLNDPTAALMAAQGAVSLIRRRLYEAIAAALGRPADLRGLSALAPRLPAALDELEAYVTAIRLPTGWSAQREAFAAILHQIDHLRRLHGRSQQKARISALDSDPLLARPACLLAAFLRRLAVPGHGGDGLARLTWFEALIEHRAHRHRRALMRGQDAGVVSVQDVFRLTDAMRWLRRSLHHVTRIAHYDGVVTRALAETGVPQTRPVPPLKNSAG